MALNSILAGFGSKRINLKAYIGAAATQASHNNPALRNEALNFYKECFKWLKDGIRPFLDGLKKQQQDELGKAFTELVDTIAMPARQTKKEKKD